MTTLPPSISSKLMTGRTALQLYRDCLRLVRHVAPGDCPKGLALRRTVRHEFRRHATQSDEVILTNLKANAIRALSNYLLAMNASNDTKLKSAMQEFHHRSVPEQQQQRHTATNRGRTRSTPQQTESTTTTRN